MIICRCDLADAVDRLSLEWNVRAEVETSRRDRVGPSEDGDENNKVEEEEEEEEDKNEEEEEEREKDVFLRRGRNK